MISMKPILAQEVITQLNENRFPGDLDGYIIMNGEEYLGYALYCVADKITTVLCCQANENALVDGVVRACIAAGEQEGATSFSVNMEEAGLKQWYSVFMKEAAMPVANEKLFSGAACKG